MGDDWVHFIQLKPSIMYLQHTKNEVTPLHLAEANENSTISQPELVSPWIWMLKIRLDIVPDVDLRHTWCKTAMSVVTKSRNRIRPAMHVLFRIVHVAAGCSPLNYLQYTLYPYWINEVLRNSIIDARRHNKYIPYAWPLSDTSESLRWGLDGWLG